MGRDDSTEAFLLHFAGMSIILWQLFRATTATPLDEEEGFSKETRITTTVWKFLSRPRLHLVLVSEPPEEAPEIRI